MSFSQVNARISNKTFHKGLFQIIFCFLLASLGFGQETIGVTYTSKFSEKVLKQNTTSEIMKASGLLNPDKFNEPFYPEIKSLQSLSKKSIYLPTYKPRHYGAFCKIEDQIESTSKIPVRFRLGSLDYVNYLEQKYVVTDRNLTRKSKNN